VYACPPPSPTVVLPYLRSTTWNLSAYCRVPQLNEPHIDLRGIASPHSLPSPDGSFIATLLSGHISIRAVETLTVVQTIKLPADLAASIFSFVWSHTAERILLAAGDEIHVFSATGDDFHATIRNPSSPAAKSTYVDFGATHREACACSAHGIKLSLFNLASAKVVEISNPKFYTASSAARGFSFRPRTHHLALLTRTYGKDTVSIHAADSREVQRSWSPDVVDAQGLSWTPNGEWLVVWESASQGRRVLFFTPDGHKYRDWCGPLPQPASGDMHDRLRAGVKVVFFSPDSQYVVVGDHGRCVFVLPTANLTHEVRLCHPRTLEPKDTLQVRTLDTHLLLRYDQHSLSKKPKKTRYGRKNLTSLACKSPSTISSELLSQSLQPCVLQRTDMNSRRGHHLCFSIILPRCWPWH
jgi:hypothetical protein